MATDIIARGIAINLTRGTRSVVGDGIQSPVNGPSAAVGAAGVLTGAYYYTQTYVTAAGETAPWAGTAVVVNPAAQQVNLTNILVGPTGTLARKIYRTKAASPDVKDYFLLATINDNTTTSYTDNIADASLGAPVSWLSSNRGYVTDGTSVLFNISNQSGAIGLGAGGAGGYANWFVGYQAGLAISNGRRNTGMGIYAGTNLTSGYENALYGAHAGQSLTTQTYNTFVGTYAGFSAGLAGGSSRNVAVGTQAAYGTGNPGLGNENVALGYYAMRGAFAVDNNIAIGAYAGQFSSVVNALWIDPLGNARANQAAGQNSGMVYGVAASTPQAQTLNLNAGVRLGALITVAQLPAAATNAGRRFNVTDSTLGYTSVNIGTTVVGGGATFPSTPVYCNGTNWVIG